MRRSLSVLAGFCIALLLFTFLPKSEWVRSRIEDFSPQSMLARKTIVMAKLSNEDTVWVAENLPESVIGPKRVWQSAIYTVDKQSAPLHTLRNKGREANTYLTYLIEHYHDLPNIVVFVHSHRNGYPGGWHNDAENYDNVRSIHDLQLEYVEKMGYVNLRCIGDPGCPNEIQPFRSPRDPKRTSEHAFANAWREIFGEQEVPLVVAVPCCSQFAVSKAQVLKRPKSDYERYHKWLMETPLVDDISGRVMEYLWHIIFGQEFVLCPSLQTCYCNVYGRNYQ